MILVVNCFSFALNSSTEGSLSVPLAKAIENMVENGAFAHIKQCTFPTKNSIVIQKLHFFLFPRFLYFSSDDFCVGT